MFRIISTLTLVSLISVAQAGVGVSATASQSRYFWGGGVGASFGEVDIITISPMIGTHLTDRLSTGVALNYTHRNDSRYEKTLKTDDFGTTVFARYSLTPQFFVEADYEFLSSEYYTSDTTTDRRDFNSFMAGGGIRTPLGGNASAYFSALYNFSYDEADSPYDDAWVIRGGVGFGF